MVVAVAVRRALPGVQVREQRPLGAKGVVKLALRARGGAEVVIEPNTVLRGTLHPTVDRTLAPKAEKEAPAAVAAAAVDAAA